jgi:hypothetical protein
VANNDCPRGFACFGKVLRSSPYKAGSAVYPGDLVKMASDGYVDACSAGDLVLGVCLSYAAAEGDAISVADDPNQLIIGQVAASEIDAQGDLFNTADIVATAGNSTYKMSRQEVDGSSQSGSATAQLRILRIMPRPNNALGANVEVVCAINEHFFGAAQANSAIGV